MRNGRALHLTYWARGTTVQEFSREEVARRLQVQVQAQPQAQAKGVMRHTSYGFHYYDLVFMLNLIVLLSQTSGKLL